ncbi:hypothetical protein [Wolbachia endosymbiont of Drosophila barbarae]|uniref:hypothetical protein n=1 Tax=Wolbachia endosymbiont of Drosophila barbarae TaxID=3377043 RepID=UPI0037FC4360
MNFVSNCQFFSLERCNKAIPDWDDTLLVAQCLYDCASRVGMTKKSELLVFHMVMQGV